MPGDIRLIDREHIVRIDEGAESTDELCADKCILPRVVEGGGDNLDRQRRLDDQLAVVEAQRRRDEKASWGR